MACNSCSRSFSLLRPEKGCPSCGFSYCSKCLNDKIFVLKLNSEKKVCAKCSRNNRSNEANVVEPPDAFYKRIAKINESQDGNKEDNKIGSDSTEKEILEKLQKLKNDNENKVKISDKEIAERLQNLKEPMPCTSDAELYSRLAKVKGVPIDLVAKKPVLPAPDLRTEQEQADDLLKQYMEQSKIDSKYEDGFEDTINIIETRLQKLKGGHSLNTAVNTQFPENVDSEDEESTVRKIIEKAKENITLEDDIFPNTNDELPFCEICNEDARVRCKGCKYLFCMTCFNEHKDDDEGCDKYEVYNPPKQLHQ